MKTTKVLFFISFIITLIILGFTIYYFQIKEQFIKVAQLHSYLNNYTKTDLTNTSFQIIWRETIEIQPDNVAAFIVKQAPMIKNNEFASVILKKFDPKTDTLFFLCRSGTRAAMALSEAVKAGWPAERSYVILGGFQGEKMKDKNSAYYGQRVGGGWKNEGLPWTYAMDQKLIY